MKFPNDEFYVKTATEMSAIFAEVPEAITNTEKVAERCNVVLNFEENHLPRFPVPEGQTLNGYFESVVHDGFEGRIEALQAVTSERANGPSGWAAKHDLKQYC